jgi:hypothetical protein
MQWKDYSECTLYCSEFRVPFLSHNMLFYKSKLHKKGGAEGRDWLRITNSLNFFTIFNDFVFLNFENHQQNDQ